MTRYISVYRCRLCGKEYAEGGTDTGRAAMNGANEAALTASGIEPGRLCMNAPTLFSVHHCDGGSYGVSEFLGFKKVDLEYKMKEIFENLCNEYKKKGVEAEVSASIFQGEFCITMRKSNGIVRKIACSANVRVLAEGCGEKFPLEGYCHDIFERMNLELDQLLAREARK